MGKNSCFQNLHFTKIISGQQNLSTEYFCSKETIAYLRNICTDGATVMEKKRPKAFGEIFKMKDENQAINDN
jgi:hypothetical protein